uniref:Cir_N domain-containing protein n=1 Tax=Macrostomum lignano TaxID=282301 RepID=A0A1I8H9G5_9PLAT
QFKLRMSANQQHWEALRRERQFQRRAFAQQQIQAAGSDPSMKGTLDSELRAQQQALDAATRRHAELTADAAATASGADATTQSSAKLPRRFTSINYAQQW